MHISVWLFDDNEVRPANVSLSLFLCNLAVVSLGWSCVVHVSLTERHHEINNMLQLLHQREQAVIRPGCML